MVLQFKIFNKITFIHQGCIKLIQVTVSNVTHFLFQIHDTFESWKNMYCGFRKNIKQQKFQHW